MKVIDYSNAYLVGEGCESFTVFDNVDVSGLILDTITELERRKLEENSRLYYPPREGANCALCLYIAQKW